MLKEKAVEFVASELARQNILKYVLQGAKAMPGRSINIKMQVRLRELGDAARNDTYLAHNSDPSFSALIVIETPSFYRR